MMLWTPIAFGVTLLACFTFFFYCWRMRHTRTPPTSIQVSAIPTDSQLPKNQFGIQKDVLDTLPTVKANELKLGVQEENSQCPICLLEYDESEVLRQLPACGHIFHTSCVDPWLEKQPTCPVCRVLLSTKASEPSTGHDIRPSASLRLVEPQPYRASSTTSTALTVELAASSTPSWVLVNPPFPLPPSIPFLPKSATATSDRSSSCKTSTSQADSSSRTDLEAGHSPQASSNVLFKDSSECPQLRKTTNSRIIHQLEGGWGSGYLKSLVSECRSCKSADARNMSSNTAASSSSSSACNIQIKSRGMKSHSVHSRRWLTESFSFVLSDTFSTNNNAALEHSSTKEPATTDQFSIRSATKSSKHQYTYCSDVVDAKTWPANATSSRDFGCKRKGLNTSSSSYCNTHAAESSLVYESRLSDSQLPLTISPEKCSFEFVPVLTGRCSMDFSFR